MMRDDPILRLVPALLAAFILLGFFAVVIALFVRGVPNGSTEVLLMLLGVLSAMASAVVNFFFGSSSGSKSKEDALLRRTPRSGTGGHSTSPVPGQEGGA